MTLKSALVKTAVWLGLMEEPVENLDPRIDEQVVRAQLHGLADDERICLMTGLGQLVSWTDNYGNVDEMRMRATAIEVTPFVRHRLAVLERHRIGVHTDGSPCMRPGTGCDTRGCPDV